jgi:hypothetical protein
MTARKIMLTSSALFALASMPNLPPVSIGYLDKPKPQPSKQKRAKVKAARKQKRGKP